MRTALVTRRPSRGRSLTTFSRKQPSEDDVSFFPTVDLSAVRAGKSLSFHFRRRPEFFFNRATSVG